MNYKEFSTRYGLTLSDQQRTAVCAVNGHVLLLAVPGSGKTTVLVARLGYMALCCGIDLSRVLTMTYTVAATKDMKSRFETLFGSELAAKAEFRTINGVSAKIIHYYERITGRKAFDLETDEKHICAIISDIYRKLRGEYLPDGEIKNILQKIGYAKNMLLSDEEIQAIDSETKAFSAIFREYNNTLRERKLMDYDDQMVYAYRILTKYPEILDFYRSSIDYVCVDEAQDTSKVQHIIIDLLSSGSGNLFMVGDEDQSIYGFRAAYPEALTGFGGKYPDAKILLMEKNYRSTGSIVSAADAFIKGNKNRFEKTMTASRNTGRMIRDLHVAGRRNQYTYLLKIASECSEETAVLYRDNSSILPVIDLFERNSVGYRCRQMDLNFFTSRSVRDICDIIRFSCDRSSGELFMQIYYKLNARINREAAEYAASHCREGRSILDYLANDLKLNPWVRKQCAALETHMNNMQRENGGRAVYRILTYMGYGEYLENRGQNDNEAQILRVIGENEPNPRRLLERIDELRDIAASGTTDPESKLIFSTIHSSKGLEYDKVILLDIIDGLLPGCPPSDIIHYEEERRLFYVGMTRARNELSIFTFDDRAQRSAFSDKVFGKRAMPEKKSYPIPVSGDKRTVSDTLITGLKPGRRLTHKHFGRGTVSDVSNGIVTIAFDDGSTHRLTLLSASAPGLITLD